jgi:hypothetical protein
MRVSLTRYHWLLLGGVILLLLLGRGIGSIVSAEPPRPTPTPLPSHPMGSEILPQGVRDKFPDLIVESISTTPAQPIVDHETIIQVTIRNQGEQDVGSGNNFFVDLYMDPEAPPEEGCPLQEGTIGDQWWGVQGDWMASGTSYVLTTEWVFTDTRAYHLFVQVDTGCSVVETDEYNNVEGPYEVSGTTDRCFRQDSHADFQYGFSNLDISHPDGMLYLSGAYAAAAPIDSIAGTPALDHRPDVMVNDITYTLPLATQAITDTARQEAPAIVNGEGDALYMAWEDGRNGQIYSKDIYFAYSLDGGQSWSDDIRVNQEPITATANQGSPALAFHSGSLPMTPTVPITAVYAIWEDSRGGNYDIYLARSSDGGRTWDESGGNPINDDGGTADQLNPSLAVGDDGTLYAAWQDGRNGNSDIYLAHSPDGGETWSRNVFVTDDPESTEQRQTSPSISVHQDRIYILWEDERNTLIGDPADIYFAWGRFCVDPDCDSLSFDLDIRVNNDSPGAEQRQPVLASHDVLRTAQRAITYTEEITAGVTEQREGVCTDRFLGTATHFAWQDYRNGENDADIYYAWRFADFVFYDWEADSDIPDGLCQPTAEEIALELVSLNADTTIHGNKKLSSPLEGYCGCLPPDHEQPCIDYCTHPQDEPWHAYQGALWEGHPAMVARGDGVFIAWSDGRNFDDYWNYDIYVASTYRDDPGSSEYLVTENVVVNDNAKLYQYLSAEEYSEYGPASARQDHPTLALCDGCALPYVAWDDNRRADPLAGCPGNHDIYFARPGITVTMGTYLSPIFDAGPQGAEWYMLDWWGVTPYGTDLTLQTRMGSTPWPDEHWSQWTGPAESAGHWVYDAPGQHIVGADGNPFPHSRYIQYRVNLANCATCAPGSSPCLSRATLYYRRLYTAFLPLLCRTCVPGGPVIH